MQILVFEGIEIEIPVSTSEIISVEDRYLFVSLRKPSCIFECLSAPRVRQAVFRSGTADRARRAA